MVSTHVQPMLGQEDMTRELSLGFNAVVKYMQVRWPGPARALAAQLVPLPRELSRLCSALCAVPDSLHAACADQGARMKLPFVGNGYVDFEALEPQQMRRLVMRSQYVKFFGGEATSESSGARVMDAAASSMNNDFTASCVMSKMGRTSLDLFYDLKVGDTTVGTGLSAMVCVAGETGARKPDPVPEGAAAHLVASPEAEAAREDSVAVMENFPLAADVVGETFVYKTTIRYSDEDMNLHLWHSNTPKFFEDAYMTLKYTETDHPLSAIAQGPVYTILCEYLSEGAAGDEIEVRVSSSVANTLDVHMYKMGRKGGGHDGEDTEDALIGRGRMACNGPTGAKL